jgi:hypothetical protein
MRSGLGLLIAVAALLWGGCAAAHHKARTPEVVPAAVASDAALIDAVFVAPRPAAAVAWTDPSGPPTNLSLAASPGQSAETAVGRERSGAVDVLRFTFDGAPMAPAYGKLAPPPQRGPTPQITDMTFTRTWPGVRMDAGRYVVDISPHAGLGGGEFGRSAEAGATVSFRPGRGPLDKLGSKQGEWYLFASASGRAVGLNMISPDGAPNTLPMAWYTESAVARVNSVRAGVGWRLGHVDAMLGYVGWQVKTDVDTGPASAAPRYHDSLVGISLSLHI